MDMVTLLLAATIALPPFGDVKVVDEIDCTKADHRFADWPKGSSRVENVLGKPCRARSMSATTATTRVVRSTPGVPTATPLRGLSSTTSQSR